MCHLSSSTVEQIRVELLLCEIRLEEAGLNSLQAADAALIFFSLSMSEKIGLALPDRLRDLADYFEEKTRN